MGGRAPGHGRRHCVSCKRRGALHHGPEPGGQWRKVHVVTMPQPLLEVHGVSLNFGGVKALSEVSIAVQPKTVTAVIGPNGAGKTSLYNVISGFYRPQAGTVCYDGRDITKIEPHRRAGMGMARTFQNIALFR